MPAAHAHRTLASACPSVVINWNSGVDHYCDRVLQETLATYPWTLDCHLRKGPMVAAEELFSNPARLSLLQGMSDKVGLRKGGMLVFVCPAALALSYMLSAQAGIHGNENQWSRWDRRALATPRGLGRSPVSMRIFVKKFDGRADVVKSARGRNRLTDAFAVVHWVHDGGGRKGKSRGQKVRKEGVGKRSKATCKQVSCPLLGL
jgi:hypothetical protein